MSNVTFLLAHDRAERLIAETQADVLTLFRNGHDTERAAALQRELAGLLRMHALYCTAFAPREEDDGERSDPRD